MHRKFSPFIFLITVIALLTTAVWAQNISSDKVWRKIDKSTLTHQPEATKAIVSNKYETFRLNKSALLEILNSAPQEFSSVEQNKEIILTLPLPNGDFSRFSLKKSSIMEPKLAAKYPEINSYLGKGIDNPTATTRFDISPNGLRGMIISNEGTIFIEPYAAGDTLNYITFNKRDLADEENQFRCLVGGDLINVEAEPLNFLPDLNPMVPNGANLRIYRLALAATAEYTNAFRQPGESDEQAKARALAQMNTTMNRVNAVYERELAIRMVLVSNTDSIIYTEPQADPYTNNSGSAMLEQNQTNLDATIGTQNYDIGHVFSTGGGGIAHRNTPCNPGSKAKGVTGLSNPNLLTSDYFAIDFVAHEVGHQFGARHTFNGSNGGCGGNSRSASSAYEPGSGTTIMAYAGLCNPQSTQSQGNDYFHVKSLEEIVNFVNSAGTCSVNTPTGNTLPNVAVAGATSYNIPKQTPFVLTAAGSDADGDSLTYAWEEYDLGPPSPPDSDADGVARPIFRSYPPTVDPSRTFPKLQYILNNANVPPSGYNCSGDNCIVGEVLPTITRTMVFQVTIRDNHAGGGAINSSTASVNVDGNSGPFQLTQPNTNSNWSGLSSQTVSWNVANTNNAPVNATNVRILLSTDGGQTFPIVLANNTANDGSETLIVPNISTTTARIKIEAVSNIFFDISDANFTISSAPNVTRRTLFDFDGDGRADVSVFRPSTGGWYLLNLTSGFTATQFGISSDKLAPADFDGDGKTDLAVFRDGTWYLQRSQLGFTGISFGAATDIPMPADFDGDGKSEIAVFRPSNGGWYILNLVNNQFNAVQFGQAGDVPVASDYDGDGKADIAVFRNGTWYIQRSRDGFTGIAFGQSGDKPVPADYDGDGKTDLAVFRPDSGTWYLLRSALGFTGVQFGLSTDKPAPADYDGDGKADIAVFREGTWYIQRSRDGFTGVAFGNSTDKPVPNAFVP